MKLYKQLAFTINALYNCRTTKNKEWVDRHSCTLQQLVENLLPSGSGIDSGCTINDMQWETLLISSSFHTTDEHGSYGRWIDFFVKVKPSLQFGFTSTIRGNFGKDQDLKEYLCDLFTQALLKEVI